MVSTQNETTPKAERGGWSTELGFTGRCAPSRASYFSPRPSGFTLTELLIVIAIIGTLVSLLLVAVQGALGRAKQAEITLELQNMGGAMEDLKTEFGAYPPNGMNNNVNTLGQTDYERMFKKAFPRSKEPNDLILALAARADAAGGGSYNITLPNGSGGLTGAEAVVFWLGGFSEDTAYPLSGIGGPSFVNRANSRNAPNPNDEVLEDRNWRFEFDLSRLGPKDDQGVFSGRYLEYDDPRDNTIRRRINLWTYTPGASRIPVQYFDTSRHDPEDYDLDMTGVAREGLYAIKQLREGATTAESNSDITWVENGKFQLLHCGTDDIWGESFAAFHLDVPASGTSAYTNVLLAPGGPFIGDIADTLGNFMGGTLEDKQE